MNINVTVQYSPGDDSLTAVEVAAKTLEALGGDTSKDTATATVAQMATIPIPPTVLPSSPIPIPPPSTVPPVAET